MSAVGLPPPQHKKSRTIDPKKVRLTILALIVIGSFVALYSRLWYLQVLAVDELKAVAKDNRVRLVEYEPPRGRILDRWGRPLVESKRTLAVSLNRGLLESPLKKSMVLVRLSERLNISLFDMYERLRNRTVSPYKPLAVAYDIPEDQALYIEEHSDDFPGVEIEKVWRRKIVKDRGTIAPHVLGYTNEISPEQLKSPEWKGYDPGDIIGQAGVESTYDEFLRGEPRIERVVVDSAGDPIGKPRVIQKEEAGADVRLTIDSRIQRITQSALTSGVMAARGAGYEGKSAAAVVLDPDTGELLAEASYPTYDAKVAADGFTERDWKRLGASTPKDYSDDALKDRALQVPLPPGSTFKPITTAAALELGVMEYDDYLPCPGTYIPPGTFTEFYNWTSSDLGSMQIPRALEISCNTFFYDLGWRMESQWGVLPTATGTFEFQRYARAMSFGRPTGVELPEAPGRVPDPEMCELPTFCEPNKEYLPGYTVNMAVGQGDLLVTPLQMAVAYAALVNGGQVLEPHVVSKLTRPDFSGNGETIKEFDPVVKHELNLLPEESAQIKLGMDAVVQGGNGTAHEAFAGFGVPVGGKTGTAEVGTPTDDLSHAWFISYAPSDDPEYVVAIYVEYAGHGGETAAPIAREIYEGIYNDDLNTSVTLGSDASD
ncbi:MAG: penicillin-binding protein 2 [Actinomycetota bacterium]|nr:penicillin-binding protein 2 [Actinomycetota bacterium]